jgi:holo-[acyl-carrier protein] synthase
MVMLRKSTILFTGRREYPMARRRATIRIGLDVQSIEEVRNSIQEFGDRYTQLVFTPHEIEASAGDVSTRASKLAGRFAAKEAVFKVLDIDDNVPLMRSIEIWRPNDQRPTVRLHGLAAELARRQGINELSVSLSHSGGVAAAAVIAQIHHQPLWTRR